MRVTEKGQVTIPIEVREKLGITPGSEITFVEEGERFYLDVRRARAPADMERFRAWLDSIEGTADAGLSTDEILDMTRGRDRRE